MVTKVKQYVEIVQDLLKGDKMMEQREVFNEWLGYYKEYGKFNTSKHYTEEDMFNGYKQGRIDSMNNKI